MKLAMQFASFVFLASAASSAATSWSGYLVDSNCYESRQRNVDPWSTSTVDRDMDADIRFCAPVARTKSFALVRQDWKMFEFDPAGNAKAAEFVRKIAKETVYLVTIAGDMNNNVLKMDSISMANKAAGPLK